MKIILNQPLTLVGFQSIVDLTPGQLPALNNFINYLGGVAGGNYSAKLSFFEGVTKAMSTLTISSTGPTNTQAFTVCNVTITGVTSASTMNHFTVSTTPSVAAANIAACINASTDLTGLVVAVAALGVVTFTCVEYGLAGNQFELSAGTLSNAVAVGFAGGSDGTSSYSLNFL